MNAAEITDKLGLHSLRQRAWVSIIHEHPMPLANLYCSTFNLLALLLVTVSTRVSNGSVTLSARLDTTKASHVQWRSRLIGMVVRIDPTNVLSDDSVSTLSMLKVLERSCGSEQVGSMLPQPASMMLMQRKRSALKEMVLLFAPMG